MTKLFISQPMKGKSDDEIIKERTRIINAVKETYGEDTEILDSYFKGAPQDATPLWYLGESLKVLSKADIAYFAAGWENARGCRIEHTCAEEYGIKTITK